MACKAYPSPDLSNSTVANLLNQTIFAVSGAVLLDIGGLSSALVQISCMTDVTTVCYGICSNADLSGIGVRIAFWISSLMQAVLVVISPEDSPQAAWSAVLLTAGVTVPAFIQKRNGALSVYHATLVLNFATFSSLVSLAVAPMCTIWRDLETPSEDSPQQECEKADQLEDERALGEEGETEIEHPDELTNLPKRRVHRQRLVLSLALLLQVALQWSWAVVLFTDSKYTQKVCNDHATVLLFGKALLVESLNHNLYLIWPMWLLFNLGITLTWAILLVHNSSDTVHPVLSRQSSRVEMTLQTGLSYDGGRVLLLLGNTLAFGLSMLFLVSSEVQVGNNCILGGENTVWSFGQIAALFIALAPLWPICVAVEKQYLRTHNLPSQEVQCLTCGNPSSAASSSSLEGSSNTEIGTVAIDKTSAPTTPTEPEEYDIPGQSLSYSSNGYLAVPSRDIATSRQPRRRRTAPVHLEDV